MSRPITVESTNGLPVKLRAKPDMSCSLYWEIPSGGAGVLMEESGSWSRIEAADQRGTIRSGWMKSDFVVSAESGDGEGKKLNASELAAMLSALTVMEKQLDMIYEVLGGRG